MNGLSAPMDELLELATEHAHPKHGPIPVITDAARACGYVPGPLATFRFALDDLSLVQEAFPRVRVERVENAFVFPTPESALAYYASGKVDLIEDAPADASHVRQLFADRLPDLEAGRPVTVTIAQRSFDLNPEFLGDLGHHDVTSRVSQLGRPYCVIHATDDEIVGFDNAERLFAAATHPKKLVALESGGHLFSARADADRVLAAVLAWFDETL